MGRKGSAEIVEKKEFSRDEAKAEARKKMVDRLLAYKRKVIKNGEARKGSFLDLNSSAFSPEVEDIIGSEGFIRDFIRLNRDIISESARENFRPGEY